MQLSSAAPQDALQQDEALDCSASSAAVPDLSEYTQAAVSTQLGVGTTFTICLAAAGDPPGREAVGAGEPPRSRRQAVMVVDNEPMLLEFAQEALAELGYEATGFASSVVALQALRAEPHRFDVVLTDEAMPQLSGTALAREIRQLRPDIPILLMSGYTSAELSERAQSAGVNGVLRKPLLGNDIAERIAQLLTAGR